MKSDSVSGTIDLVKAAVLYYLAVKMGKAITFWGKQPLDKRACFFIACIISQHGENLSVSDTSGSANP